MPFPYFQNVSTDFTGVWTSPRKRKAPAIENMLPMPLLKRKGNAILCPHSVAIVRSTRQLVAEKEQCPICLEDYFSTPAGGEKITPVKMGCSHVFCRECIETHLSSSARCALPWCEADLLLQPNTCELCAVWQKNHAATGSLTVTVRADEMFGNIKDALEQLALDNTFFKLPKTAKSRLFAHIRKTLKRYEWQFHSGIGLAKLLDPFLLAIDINDARKHYGSRLSCPAPDPTKFPPRDHDPDDYELGQEPWIAALFRQWALDYEKENGEVKEGWGVWAKRAAQGVDWTWEWPYKCIMAHKISEDGRIEYLVKWVGQRYVPTWVCEESLSIEGRELYAKAHHIDHRRNGKLIRIEMNAEPGVMESELGHL
ncbi:hypothetical protein BKA66DRAFT_577802 [Pyrenochaeta sp. MPI-SDFR-AT-0127]|nr:hypothetical protein BKA66DRAFT_577802 [Pyrenochaeta sp. MPI-SDFR-AT-0127]